MTTYWLQLTLLSDTTFGRGEGVPGLVDEEVEHDRFGLPFLHGRTLKGLLVEECANILYALHRQDAPNYSAWETAANRLFGVTGTSINEAAIMQISHARLPQDLRQLVQYQVEHKKIDRVDVVESLTDIRHQTSMDETGQPADGSLRSMRVILRNTVFLARLRFHQTPTDTDLALLAACVLAFRRAGVGRNRGRGQLVAELLNGDQQPVTQTHFAKLAEVLA